MTHSPSDVDFISGGPLLSYLAISLQCKLCPIPSSELLPPRGPGANLSALTARSPELLLCGVSVVEEEAAVPPNEVVTIVVGVRTWWWLAAW